MHATCKYVYPCAISKYGDTILYTGILLSKCIVNHLDKLLAQYSYQERHMQSAVSKI